MNPEYFLIFALTWKSMGFIWCLCFFALGLWIGYFIWRGTSKQAKFLEMENQQALKEYEKRKNAYAVNREQIESLLDPDSTP